MTKQVILVGLLLLAGLGLNAQSKFGIKVATGKILASETSSMVSADNMLITHNIDFENYSNSTSVGFFANRKFSFLFAQAEVLYTSYKANYNIVSYIDDNLPAGEFQEQYQNLDLHIIGGLSFNKFRIGVGPVFHKTLDFSSELSDYEFYTEKKRNLNAGFQAMLAYDLGPLTIDLKYEDMFNKVGDHIYFGDNKSKFKSNLGAISLGLGIGF